MRLIIHDLDQQNADLVDALKMTDVTVVADNGKIRPCLGCFDCWIKTPGKCIQKDDYNNMAELLSQCDEVCIISECRYGSFSPFIKNVMDRSLGYLHPYFKMIDGEMHHRRRYPKVLKTRVYFYGIDLTEEEKNTFKEVISRNALNLSMDVQNITYLESIGELKGVAI